MFARKHEIELLKKELFKVREELSDIKDALIRAQNPYKWEIGDKVGGWIITDRHYKTEIKEFPTHRAMVNNGNKSYTLVNIETGRTDNWVDEKDVPDYFNKPALY